MDATDAINAGLFSTLSGDADLYAALGSQGAEYSLGVWNMQGDDGAPLPLVTFRQVVADYEYSFGGVSCERYVYWAKAFTEESASAAARLLGHLRRVLTDAEFPVAGYELLLCRPTGAIPPEARAGDNNREQYMHGILLEVLVTPA